MDLCVDTQSAGSSFILQINLNSRNKWPTCKKKKKCWSYNGSFQSPEMEMYFKKLNDVSNVHTFLYSKGLWGWIAFIPLMKVYVFLTCFCLTLSSWIQNEELLICYINNNKSTFEFCQKMPRFPKHDTFRFY